MLFLIASGKPGFELGGFAANGFGEHSPGRLHDDRRARRRGGADLRVPDGHPGRDGQARARRLRAASPSGSALTLIHLIGIPVTNLSVNPARSTGPAIVVGGWALQQLWLFWAAPIAGAIAAGLAYPMLASEEAAKPAAPAKPEEDEDEEEEEEEKAPPPAAKVSKMQKAGGKRR